MESLPVELVQEIIGYLDPSSLYQLCRVAKNLRSFIPSLAQFHAPSDVFPQKNRIRFQQKGAHHHFTRIDAIEKPSDQFPMGRRVGMRASGDRCIVGQAWLGSQSLSWTHSTNYQVLYFEVKVLWCALDCNMRIGLVHDQWEFYRPPGSLEHSVGYCSDDGTLSIGSRYDLRYLFGPSWSAGDIMGCGYYKQNGKGKVFFTKNGRWIGDAPQAVEYEDLNFTKRWHAAFSASTHCEVEVNMGKESFHYPILNGVAPFLVDRFELPKAKAPTFVSREFCKVSESQNGTILDFLPNYQGARSVQCTMPLELIEEAYNPEGFYYFEIKVISRAPNPTSFMSIGLSNRPYSEMHHIGWNPGSIGFHSDDGRVFINSYNSECQISKGYTIGSIIGCGYNPIQKTVFFTQDGSRLVDHDIHVMGPLYISIAATMHWKVSVHIRKNQIKSTF
jgi:hypothetical protein